MAAGDETGRANQKKRTRTAILAACREIIRSGGTVTMPEVARSALVSEATAYRYFPDLASLVSQALAGTWPSPAEALAPVAGSGDPVERVAFACEFLLRGVLARQAAVRAMISAALVRPELTASRPGIRFGLIDQALAPLDETLGATDPAGFAQLKQDLAAVISAEALFSLTDLAGLTPSDAIASLVRTATTITSAALREDPQPARLRSDTLYGRRQRPAGRITLDERMTRPGGHPDAFSETGGVTAGRNPGTAATIAG